MVWAGICNHLELVSVCEGTSDFQSAHYKSEVILIYISLYDYYFSLAVFNTFSLMCICNVCIFMLHGMFIFLKAVGPGIMEYKDKAD